MFSQFDVRTCDFVERGWLSPRWSEESGVRGFVEMCELSGGGLASDFCFLRDRVGVVKG